MNTQSRTGEHSYADVIGHLERLRIPLRELHGEGCMAVTLPAGRIPALAFASHEANLLWVNPSLSTARDAAAAGRLPGGLGGDRLWFAPELHYHWQGQPDWVGLSNYHVPSAVDPGEYAFVDTEGESVAMEARVSLLNGVINFAIRREVRLARRPLGVTDPVMRSVQFVGIETTHRLMVDARSQRGEVGLWHLLQVPVGSVMIVPICSWQADMPLSYGLPGGWRTHADCVTWRVTGKAGAKIGFPAAALTGRAAAVRKLPTGRWCLLVREFATDPSKHYADHPYEVPRSDQVVQLWDGGGFGELEYHSPALILGLGQRELLDADRLWAFGGAFSEIAIIAKHLLGLDIRPHIDIAERVL